MADQEDLKRLHAGQKDLTQSDFQKADLSGLDLSNRDFTNSHLEYATAIGTNFSGSNFSGAHITRLNAQNSNFSDVNFGRVFVEVDLRGADLRNASLKRAHLNNVNLTGADIRGADFTSSYLLLGTLFDDVKFDISTRFDGAECVRPLSRLAPFQNYVFERGKLHRKHEAEVDQKNALDAAASTIIPEVNAQQIPQASGIAVQVIKQRIVERPIEVEQLSTALSKSVGEELDRLTASIPNDPAALDRHNSLVDFLSKTQTGLNQIAAAIHEAREQTEPAATDKKFDRATEIVANLGKRLGDWIGANSTTVVEYSSKTVLLGLGCWFLTFCGAPSYMAFPALAGILGGKELADFIRGAQTKKQD